MTNVSVAKKCVWCQCFAPAELAALEGGVRLAGAPGIASRYSVCTSPGSYLVLVGFRVVKIARTPPFFLVVRRFCVWLVMFLDGALW